MASQIDSMNETFYQEVKAGLQSRQKKLPSKYFYDATGDQLFQQIMDLPEYYPSRCEREIFLHQTAALAQAIQADQGNFDLIELGAGDGSKTFHLLQFLCRQKYAFSYLPIDISGNILNELEGVFKQHLKGYTIHTIQGEYLNGLKKAASNADKRKVVLFLGANIGNFEPADALVFCRQVRRLLAPGDLFLVGFDLKKHPAVIKAAYDDQQGITRLFNLNLLNRMNADLGAGFSLDQFDHYCSYDPITGACKSYLVALADQEVSFPTYKIKLQAGESIWTEISQKYSLQEITVLAEYAGFKQLQVITDSKGWFANVIWSI